MDTAEKPVRECSVLMRRTISWAVATWIAIAVLLATFAFFWRIAYAPPHAFWATITTGAVIVSGVLTVLFGGWQVVRGPYRLRAFATVLLGTTPIIWFAMFLLALYLSMVNVDTTAATNQLPSGRSAFGLLQSPILKLDGGIRDGHPDST